MVVKCNQFIDDDNLTGNASLIHWTDMMLMTAMKLGPTKEACTMAVPSMSTRPRTSTLRMSSTHPAIRNANHG